MPLTPASRSDRWSALLLCAALLPLYLLTMYPDVLASGDSAKFQYIGPVLGTPHPPGYPLYMLVSYAWSWLPLGTLAWRMNLLSIVAALLAVACVYAAGRRLGAGRANAALVAAALGVGRVFWEKSLAAEVYSIGAALVAAALWRVLVWRDTRQTRDLLIPVALLAAGLGNHLTIAMVAPAFVAFALAVDARSVLRWRVVGAGLLLVLAGLSQYGYILWRTASQSPFLEASARTSVSSPTWCVPRDTRTTCSPVDGASCWALHSGRSGRCSSPNSASPASWSSQWARGLVSDTHGERRFCSRDPRWGCSCSPSTSRPIPPASSCRPCRRCGCSQPLLWLGPPRRGARG